MSKQNLLTSQLSILLLGVVIGVFASIGFSYISKPSIHQVGTACTAEAKICPDGSTVGRVGPNCEFTPCSATISKPPGYFDTGCSIDDDCVFVENQSVHQMQFVMAEPIIAKESVENVVIKELLKMCPIRSVYKISISKAVE